MKIKLSIIALVALTSLHATTLSQAVKTGISSDPEILSEVSRYEGKKSSVSLSQSGYYPSLNLGAGIGLEDNKRENPNSVQSNKKQTRKEASARFRQPLFEGFKTSSDVARSTADKEVVKNELYTLTENKALKIVKAYVNVLKTQKIIALAQTNLQTHKEILSSIEQRYKQGVSDKADLIQIKGRVASAEADFISAKNNALDAKAQYIKVVGEEPQDLENIDDSSITIPSSLEETQSAAVKQNPAIITAQKNVELVQSRKETSQSGYYPHLFGDLSANYKDEADGIDGTQEDYQAMLRVEWNIFDGFKDKSSVEIAQKEVLTAQQKKQETSRQLILESTLAWNAYSLLNEQQKPLQAHVDYSLETKSLYNEQYNVGRRSLVDVLNSQVEYFNADKALITAQYDKIAAKYRILNSMGRLNSTLGVQKVYNEK